MLNNFIAWFKNYNPDTIILKYWRRKKTRTKVVKSLETKKQAEQYQQIIATKAYLLWEADGKLEGKDEYYWQLAIDHLEGNYFPTIYKPYYKLEKRVLEPVDAWIDKQAFFAILGKLGNLAVVVAIITFIFGEDVRRDNEVFSAWQTITSAHEQSGSGGRIKALQFLNSRPLRFPYIGWTKDSFWDKNTKTCKEKLVFGRRWQREPLVGLSANNNAYLKDINLCDANLERVNLESAYLKNANLESAVLKKANLQKTILENANLESAVLKNANLQKTILVNANLQSTGLGSANLQLANLWSANLQEAAMGRANLQSAYLEKANLQSANLQSANLQSANLWVVKNLTSAQIKSACFWDKAIYKGKWNREKKTYVALEPDNTNYIKKLKQDTASNSQETVDCSQWQADP
ncbi:MAG: pentapeptide repeat-containing protein [Cyanobacteria bacterium P01_A01_bin.84]